VNNGETAFTADPLAVLGENASIVQNSSLIEQDALSMNGAGEVHFVRVEIVKT